MKKVLFIALGLILTFFLISCEQKETADHYPPGKNFTASDMKGPILYPKFNLVSAYDNGNISNESYAGQVQLVVFFATWCKSCIEEISTLRKTQETFKEQGFTVVGISTGFEDKKSIINLAKKTNTNYPLLMGDTKVAKEFGGVTTIPVAFLINREGAVVKKYVNHIEFDVLSADISSLLL